MGKQQTKKSKRQAELRQNVRGGGQSFIVRGKRFTLAGHATGADIAEHLRGVGYMRGAAVKWRGSTYMLDADAMGDPTLVRA